MKIRMRRGTERHWRWERIRGNKSNVNNDKNNRNTIQKKRNGSAGQENENQEEKIE